jgi:hypothetical protein
MKVDCCTAGIWRIKNFHSNLRLDFKTFLELKPSVVLNNDIESGEGLISYMCENNQFKLSIGTEDEEFLASRASTQKWMPHRFEDIFSKNSVIEFIPNGLKVVFSSLEANEIVKIQFIMAWSSKTHNELSTWFAVEQSPDYVLKQFDIS